MAEYLVIGCKDEDSAMSALAVAADIAAAKDAQVDIATSPQCAPIIRLGKTPRQVLEIDISPSMPADLSWETVKKAPFSGMKNLLSAASKASKIAASSAMENFKQYRETIEKLRLAHYDAALDLDATAAGLFAARSANTEKVYGFAAENIPDAAPGASLLYHESRAVSKNMSRREQCRKLAAQILNYAPPPLPEWDFIDTTPPADIPESPFILLCGKIPAPFMAALNETGLPLYTPDSEINTLAAARMCRFAVGTNISIPAAAGVKSFFIGGATYPLPNSHTVESPSALREGIAALPGASPPEAKTPPEMPKAETAEMPKAETAAETLPKAETAADENPPESPSSGGGLKIIR